MEDKSYPQLEPSDSQNHNKLSPSPKFREQERHGGAAPSSGTDPATPRRLSALPQGLFLNLPPKDAAGLNSSYSRVPLSPKLDAAETYGSPVIPRRSRGLDFSRAATSLHHSTLAKSSPDCSPTLGAHAMNIPGKRRSSHFPELPSSLWGGKPQDRTTVSTSLGSTAVPGSDSSSDSDDEDAMDDIDDSILTTPQINNRTSGTFGLWGQPQPSPGSAWMTPSTAAGSLLNFQRARMRSGKLHKTGKIRHNSSSSSSMNSPASKSPPIGAHETKNGYFARDGGRESQSRRGSISWAANQLHIDGSESDEPSLKKTSSTPGDAPTTPGRDGHRGVLRRAVTRRSDMLPKTKGFARIRAALFEESAPVETEVRREATVIKQVRENDMVAEPTIHPKISGVKVSDESTSTEADNADSMEDFTAMSVDERAGRSSFQQEAIKNSKGDGFWNSFAPPAPSLLPRSSMSAMSDDSLVDASFLNGFAKSFAPSATTETQGQDRGVSPTRTTTPYAAAIDIRRVNNKRRRDNDFDPMSMKRRAVSPSLSVHNSPVMQSPLQRDTNTWSARMVGSEKGDGTTNGDKPKASGAKRVGALQGMTDTHDGLMKMCIE